MLQKVVCSTIIDAPIERVWAVLRDFNSHDRWHGVVDSSRIREQLLSLDDREHKSSYCIVESSVPLQR